MFTTRKVIAGTVSGIMCLSMLAAGAAALDVAKTPETITLDGKLNEAYWAAAEWNPVAIEETGGITNDTVLATAWDDNNLYFAFKVVDDTVVKENLSTNIYCNDGVEIFLDSSAEKSEKYTANTLHIFFQLAEDKIEMQGGAGTWDNILDQHPDVKILHVETDDGYTVEAMIPFADMFVDAPAVGTQIAFSVSNNDDDNPDSWADADRVPMSWIDDFAYDKPITWDTLTLAKELVIPEPEPEVETPAASADTFDLTAVAAAAAALSGAAFAVSKKKSR